MKSSWVISDFDGTLVPFDSFKVLLPMQALFHPLRFSQAIRAALEHEKKFADILKHASCQLLNSETKPSAAVRLAIALVRPWIRSALSCIDQDSSSLLIVTSNSEAFIQLAVDDEPFFERILVRGARVVNNQLLRPTGEGKAAAAGEVIELKSNSVSLGLGNCHHDLELIQLAERRVLLNPRRSCKQAFLRAGVKVEVSRSLRGFLKTQISRVE